MAQFDPAQTPGAFQAPPENAPRELSQPLDPALVQTQLDRARANEKALAPLKPQGAAPPIALSEALTPRPADRSHQPAASQTDSPSRGIPQPIADPGKVITGGFGDAGEAQYYPLDGSELKELVRHLMDELNSRIEDDLRFHIAITYPRIRARVIIEVEGYAQEHGFQIQREIAREKTPVEIARLHGDQVVFALVALRQEFDQEGTAENPPDRMRDELQIPKPRKQYVGTGMARSLVDTVEPAKELF